MTQSDWAADNFFRSIHPDQMSAYERRLLDSFLGVGRKPVRRGRVGSPPVPSVEATVRAVREQQRRKGLRPKAPRYEFTESQMAAAHRALEAQAK